MIGYIAALLTSSCTFFQLHKTLKSGKVRDLSLMTYITLAMGLTCWLIHGIMIGDWPVIIGNSVSMVSVSAILILIIKGRYE